MSELIARVTEKDFHSPGAEVEGSVATRRTRVDASAKAIRPIR